MPIAHLIDRTTLRITAEETFHQGTLFQASMMRGTTPVPLTFLRADGPHYYYQCDYELGHEYRLKVNNGVDTPIIHQPWLHTQEFATLYHYDGSLGPEYSPQATTFRVWAPTATQVELRLYQDPVNVHFMQRQDRGVFALQIPGDLQGTAYTYVVHVEGRIHETLDPYAWMNLDNSTKSMVIDPSVLGVDLLTDGPPRLTHPTEMVLYELSVRDFSVHGAQEHRGKYVAFEEECAHDVRYLKGLGITHVQLLPVYDFGSVWDHDPTFYNWGYDPVQLNTPEGSYATSPNDITKLLEFQRMVKALHQQGLRVVMDMVFNHVFSHDAFMWERLVPGYFFRHQAGELSNGSFCGNDIETRQSMVRQYVIDSALRFVTTFGVDGFRLDLMGLIDLATINALRAALDKIDPTLVLYGEGWQMFQTFAAQTELATIPNHGQTPRVGYFNDHFRNGFKNLNHPETIYSVFAKTDAYLPITQSINYVECHDNETLFDELGGHFEHHQLITMMMLLAPGVPFLHAGQEFFRTKQGVENSYCSPDEINALDWSRQDRYRLYTEFVRRVIAFRSAHPALTHPDAQVRVSEDMGLKIFHYEHQHDSVKLVLNLSHRKILRPLDAHLYSHTIESMNLHVPEMHAFSMVCL